MNRFLFLSLILTTASASATTGVSDKKALKRCIRQIAAHKNIYEIGGKVVADVAVARDLAERRSQAYGELSTKLRAALGNTRMDIIRAEGRLVVRFPNEIFFPSKEASLAPGAETSVAALADALRSQPNRTYMVFGHTDSLPIGKKNPAFGSNMELSVERAQVVVAALAKAGIAEASLGAGGYGEFRPTADNSTPEGRQRNRRLEVVVLPNPEEIPVVAAR